VIELETARNLLNFCGLKKGRISEEAAEAQLRGAVSVHNMLEEQGVAYLADEVGMGKTYVALGALALMRHFNPKIRVLVMAPRANIQNKWMKEVRNFVANNVIFPDLRVKALNNSPARALVSCGNLMEFVQEVTSDPDRDFFLRYSSFSLPLGEDTKNWKRKRDQLLEFLPWLDKKFFNLQNKEQFKNNYAAALCLALPIFDLVIVDEAHNFKGGIRSGAARNQGVAHAFGHSETLAEILKGNPVESRISKIVLLSATPIENDYAQLWNQLKIFGKERVADELADDTDIEKKKAAVGRFLIRRVTTMKINGMVSTKNQYRREWRAGGVETHDDPLAIPNNRQRLTVALIQKKVSEILESAKFNHSFQIGMLASFESFLETSKAKATTDGESPSIFDDAEQTDDPAEREGADVSIINTITRDFRRRFEKEMHHPKMDALIKQLAGGAFNRNEKALVFVRRVASVKELQRKLEEHYDEWIIKALREGVKPEIVEEIVEQFKKYKEERQTERKYSSYNDNYVIDAEEGEYVGKPQNDNKRGADSFFAWYFRGEGPPDILSGATVQHRLTEAGTILSTFFEENHVAFVLGVKPEECWSALQKKLKMDDVHLRRKIRRLASRSTFLGKAEKIPRRNIYSAFQHAALCMIAENASENSISKIALLESYNRPMTGQEDEERMPDPVDYIEMRTFFTELRRRFELCKAILPEATQSGPRMAYREREIRREMISAMCSLGHPLIDIFVIVANRSQNLSLGAREREKDASIDIINAFLDNLERQSVNEDGMTSYRELAQAAAHYDLIIDVNLPDFKSEIMPLESVYKRLSYLLSTQQPIGGMYGKVNERLVKQFRMPGYPMILVTTDLLQEGEDLHTFCSSIYHYGIAWMPSSIEQRTGRIDRVSSQTERRLTRLERDPMPEEKLQVYYPHLRETVEVYQVNRVLERLDKFIELMHKDLLCEVEGSRNIHIARAVEEGVRKYRLTEKQLVSAFPIPDRLLYADRPARALAVEPRRSQDLRDRFDEIINDTFSEKEVKWEKENKGYVLWGTFILGNRLQPFMLLLRSVAGKPALRCISPVGLLPRDKKINYADFEECSRGRNVRIGLDYSVKLESYDVTVEGDTLISESDHDRERIRQLVIDVNQAADEIERKMNEEDQSLESFREDLSKEEYYER